MGDQSNRESDDRARFWEEKENYKRLLSSGRSAAHSVRSNNPTADGEDFTQDAVVESLKMPIEQWENIKNPAAYTGRIVQNRAFAHRRKHTREAVTISDDLSHIPDQTHSEKVYEARILMEEVLRNAPDGTRELLEMADVEELSGKEMALRLKITPSALRQRLARIRSKVKRLLSVTNTDPPHTE